jgi:hypothetical protein
VHEARPGRSSSTRSTPASSVAAAVASKVLPDAARVGTTAAAIACLARDGPRRSAVGEQLHELTVGGGDRPGSGALEVLAALIVAAGLGTARCAARWRMEA